MGIAVRKSRFYLGLPDCSSTTQREEYRGLEPVDDQCEAVNLNSCLHTLINNDFTDHQVGILVSEIEREVEGGKDVQLIGGFGGSEGRLSFEGGFSSASSSGDGNQVVEGENRDKLMDITINATIVLAAGTFGITKLLTIDYDYYDYWHGWTIFEILRYTPQHNWSAYEEALKENPFLAKMMISGVVYSIGDWIAQVNYNILVQFKHFFSISRLVGGAG
ncbi:hypothetical protein L2E82_31597 [Cichorium intybus]|uniref:Uncharacterized protein n=1 Tax=Cichorium intybus TaxID=13427 RepID=A0ACB9BF75_CICIN|nr:hypothetical protein L2E82_31597 [Cichorium intybus]